MHNEDSLMKLIQNVIKQMRKILDKEIMQFNIGHSEMKILMILYLEDGITQEKLNEKIEVDRSNIGRTLKKLEELKYIVRYKNEDDARSKIIFLCDKALKIKNSLMKIKNDLEKTINMNLKTNEMNILIELLEKIFDNLKEENYVYFKNQES